ncbi:SDR family NAD(P)-dependent oxidoreductase, partial [Pseudomonas viridiflava]|uniref:SDR family NAD(P)-dependent oxidoreductase n=1 Tax=Pseudomonas viridiflava TaxID=33069 RepID=UPI000F01718E
MSQAVRQLSSTTGVKSMGAGRVAFITGAAMGIGAAIAQRLGEDGHRVVVADINRGAAEEMVAGLRAQGIDAEAAMIDIGDAESIAEVFASLPRCDVLVNNAGIARTRAFLDCDLADWQRVLNI